MGERTRSEAWTELGALRRIWRDYGLSIAVGAMFLVSLLLHAIFGWWQYVADQEQQGSVPMLAGPHGYLVYFGEWTFQNWQSEFLEVLVLISLTSVLIHKGSAESKDGTERMERTINRIERKVDALAKEAR